ATARLLSTIARLPQGAVVLPGLDTDLPDPAWRVIAGGGDGAGDGARSAAGHPQYAMAAFLREMEVERDAVAVLGTPANRSRERLVSHALCPAAASECWQERLDAATVTAALGGVTVIEAANAEEEALAIAVAMREAVETAGKQ